MGLDRSRRRFLQAGLALPAAGLVSSCSRDPVAPSSSGVVYRTLGKTGLKVSGVGYGIGFVPIPEVVSRALDMGINYYDTARSYGDSEEIFSGVIKGRQRDKIVIHSFSVALVPDGFFEVQILPPHRHKLAGSTSGE